MTDISPISNQDDILREASANAPQPHISSTVAPQDSPDYYSLQIDPINQQQLVPKPQPTVQTPVGGQTLSVPATRLATDNVALQPIGETSFTYRLPMMSYIIAWSCVFLAILVVALIGSTLNAIVGLDSSTNAIYLANQKSQYNGILLTYGIILASVVTLVYALLSGKKLFRYIGLGIAVVAMAFELYKAGPILNVIAGPYGGAYITLYLTMYLPYVFLPIITIVYLLGSKARQAYV